MSQEQQILEHLKAGRSITPIEALERFGCFRLGARIHDLKSRGYAISSRKVPVGDGKSVAQYTLDAR